MAKAKEHINLAFIGHVDHGKSTLVGHLLLKAGAIAEQQLDDGENKFRFVMDKLGELTKNSPPTNTTTLL